MALQLLMGGALFLAVQTVAGPGALVLLAAVLMALELTHDLRLYRRDRRVAYRRWSRWHG